MATRKNNINTFIERALCEHYGCKRTQQLKSVYSREQQKKP